MHAEGSSLKTQEKTQDKNVRKRHLQLAYSLKENSRQNAGVVGSSPTMPIGFIVIPTASQRKLNQGRRCPHIATEHSYLPGMDKQWVPEWSRLLK